MTTWKLCMCEDDFDFIIDFLNNNELPNIMKYEKGLVDMVDGPALNDTVLITCRDKLIAKGYIYKTFHSEYNPFLDSVSIYANIMIDQIVYESPYMSGNGRNWTKVEE
jgi:hypothetical protein